MQEACQGKQSFVIVWIQVEKDSCELSHQGTQAVCMTYRDHVQAEVPMVEGSEGSCRY